MTMTMTQPQSDFALSRWHSSFHSCYLLLPPGDFPRIMIVSSFIVVVVNSLPLIFGGFAKAKDRDES